MGTVRYDFQKAPKKSKMQLFTPTRIALQSLFKSNPIYPLLSRWLRSASRCDFIIWLQGMSCYMFALMSRRDKFWAYASVCCRISPFYNPQTQVQLLLILEHLFTLTSKVEATSLSSRRMESRPKNGLQNKPHETHNSVYVVIESSGCSSSDLVDLDSIIRTAHEKIGWCNRILGSKVSAIHPHYHLQTDIIPRIDPFHSGQHEQLP